MKANLSTCHPGEQDLVRRPWQSIQISASFWSSCNCGRTTAAIAASRFGSVLKMSEDGLVSFFQNGNCIWDM